jgi:farnesyl diphosphate synthase
MRYAMLGGGKRLRPHLAVETARLFGRDDEGVLRAGVALECVHGYSLVHDDLPAMDDDDLRRGKPTLHKAFDEATAILAGDALVTFAFDVVADEPTDPDPGLRASLVVALARASGVGGMAGGQMLDLEAEGRFASDGRPLPGDEDSTLRLQAMKTGALLAASVDMGRDPRARRRARARRARDVWPRAGPSLPGRGRPPRRGRRCRDRGQGDGKGRGSRKIDPRLLVGHRRRPLAPRPACRGRERTPLAGFGERADALRRTAYFVAKRQN